MCKLPFHSKRKNILVWVILSGDIEINRNIMNIAGMLRQYLETIRVYNVSYSSGGLGVILNHFGRLFKRRGKRNIEGGKEGNKKKKEKVKKGDREEKERKSAKKLND